ncbi:hypothetical protein L6R50_19490 [Myxococcota bacterium]|nr:hypothetical protein [Myxococcota bacterium]
MARSPFVLPLLALAPFACAQEAAPIPAATGEFEPSLADGHFAEEHTQVAPGVHLLTELIESGAVRYSDLEPPLDPAAVEAENARRAARAVGDYCYEYDYKTYSDRTRSGSMFGGDPSWYASATAYSYRYDGPGPSDYDYDQVTTYITTSSPNPIDYVSAMAYVYVNGAYAGYVSNAGAGVNYAYAYGTWDAECVDGNLSVEARLYHTLSDASPRSQYLYLSNVLTARVACCP